MPYSRYSLNVEDQVRDVVVITTRPVFLPPIPPFFIFGLSSFQSK